MKRSLLQVVIALVCLGQGVAAFAEAVWIDVRTAMEHTMDSIEGDPRIPHDEIVDGVAALYPDKDTEIHLYCRSGGKAGKAQAALKSAGYTNVVNEGGIDDAREARGLAE